MTQVDGGWSGGLREQTLAALREPPLLPDGWLHVKHHGGGYGRFEIVKLVGGRYVLHSKDDPDAAPQVFDSADAVVAAGWAVD